MRTGIKGDIREMKARWDTSVAWLAPSDPVFHSLLRVRLVPMLSMLSLLSISSASALMALAPSALAANDTARDLSLEEVRAALKDHATAWTPNPEARNAHLPVRGGAIEEADAVAGFWPYADSSTDAGTGSDDRDEAAALPEHFDWRDQNGFSYMSPINAQGDCGSCVSFALAATLESHFNIICDTPDRTFHLSRQFLHSCGGATCRGGWQVSQAVDFAVRHGVPDAACLPYQDADIACSDACADANQRALRGFSVKRPTVGFVDVLAIKRALLRGPLLSTMILFADLEFYGSGTYRHVTGDKLGSHAIVLIGWNDASQAWIARNSWGEDWGEGGYFQVAWDDVSLPGRYTWQFDLAQGKSSNICSLPR